ncbi:glycosyltransferase [Paraburkholderia sediminicola]|uniref:glycosyltransferase n=1 Tax=Paraburkholderia sediminicola TaxID=458836 RepID=UPI0038BAEAD2
MAAERSNEICSAGVKMEKSPLVSVYIPTKNRKETLRRALRSVADQDYENIEIVIVDDGSTDGTQELVETFLNNQRGSTRSVKYYKNDVSNGACQARNKAIEISTGTYVTGLDDDDFFEGSRISRFVAVANLLTSHSCLFTGYRYQTLRRGEDFLFNWISEIDEVTHRHILKRNCLGNQIFTTRERMLEIDSFDKLLPAWQDYDMWIRLIKKFGSAKRLDNYSYFVDTVSAPDRISDNQQKIRAAHRIFLKKHPEYNGEKLEAFLSASYIFYGSKSINPMDFMSILFEDRKYAYEVAKQMARNILFK